MILPFPEHPRGLRRLNKMTPSCSRVHSSMTKCVRLLSSFFGSRKGVFEKIWMIRLLTTLADMESRLKRATGSYSQCQGVCLPRLARSPHPRFGAGRATTILGSCKLRSHLRPPAGHISVTQQSQLTFHGRKRSETPYTDDTRSPEATLTSNHWQVPPPKLRDSPTPPEA